MPTQEGGRELAKHVRLKLSTAEPAERDWSLRVSGVLIPITLVGDEAHVLLTRRSRELASHPGEISFPGGRVDKGETPLAAALRETHEEVGLAAQNLELLGHLTDYRTFRDDLICTYVGWVEFPLIPGFPASSDEVEDILLVSIASLLAPGTGSAPPGTGRGEVDERFPGSARLPPDAPAPPKSAEFRAREEVPPRRLFAVAYEGRTLPWAPGVHRTVHYWHLSDGSPLWGITGEIVARLLRRVYGWEPPAAAREIRSLQEFRP